MTLEERTAAAVEAYETAANAKQIEKLDTRCLQLIAECTDDQADRINAAREAANRRVGGF